MANVIPRKRSIQPTEAKNTAPVYSVAFWATKLGVPLLNMRYALDSTAALSHLKGAEQLSERQAKLAANIAKTVKV